ncbi:MAG TPA: GNAT family N-acetyltransferase [Candidatus Paceibacterota bacterium]|nr:GNAT family N-acetyltransferase [Candidatus Paceibacterota bacterium]
MPDGVKIFSNKKLLTPREAAALYIELGWGTEKQYMEARMRRSLANCDIVVFARDGAGELVGVARALSDFAIETKILDMIVAPEYQRQGIGRRMMREIERLARGTNVYFETEPKNFGFAAKCGYAKRKGLTVFVKKR